MGHGRLAEEFISIAEHVVGKQEKLQAVCILPDDDISQCREEIISKVRMVGDSKGVVILTDMFGGTPSNLAISLMGDEAVDEQVEVVAGINVPMLIKLLSVRKKTPIDEAVLIAQDAGRKYINVARNLLRKQG